MNDQHLEFLVTDTWRELLRDQIVPWALGETDLGDDLLEIGPGPGLTTDLLHTRVGALTAVEIDESLADALATRFAGTNVTVVPADATDLPLPDGRFTAAVCFTMLHHVPTVAGQDALFAEAARVLRPGGTFVASDSVASADLEALHDDDVYNPVDPTTVGDRLRGAGFVDVDVEANPFGWRARARTAADV